MSSDPAVASALQSLAEGIALDASTAEAAFGEVLDGQVPETRVASLLTALRMREETAEVLVGATRAVRSRMIDFEVPPDCRPLLDTCGTGGDGARSFNVSTAVAIVATGCGVKVAKHGNRSASGNSGSSEVLAELGVAIEPEGPVLMRCIQEAGIVFLFAPRFHPALRGLAALRKQLPFRTLFNLIGPLANPARPEYQLIGVPRPGHVGLFTAALQRLAWSPEARAAVVHGSDGLDEVTLGATTRVGWTNPVEHQVWEPSQFGLSAVDPRSLQVDGPAQSAHNMRALLAGESGPIRDVVLANTAAALLVARKAANLEEGVALAAESLDSGAAADVLARWVHLSQQQA